MIPVHSSFALPVCPNGCGGSSLPALTKHDSPPFNQRERGEDISKLMFDAIGLKLAVGWLCATPVFVIGASTDTAAEKVVLYGGAATAAAVVWHKVLRPLIAGIGSLNDAYRAALIAEIQIAEIQKDLAELKESINAKN